MSKAIFAKTVSAFVVSIMLSCENVSHEDWTSEYMTLKSGALVGYKKPKKKELLLCYSDMAKVLVEGLSDTIWIVVDFAKTNEVIKDTVDVVHMIIELNAAECDDEMFKLVQDDYIICLLKASKVLEQNHVIYATCLSITDTKPNFRENVIYVDSFYSSLKVPNISIILLG